MRTSYRRGGHAVLMLKIFTSMLLTHQNHEIAVILSVVNPASIRDELILRKPVEQLTPESGVSVLVPWVQVHIARVLNGGGLELVGAEEPLVS